MLQTRVSWERKGNEQLEFLILGIAPVHDRALWHFTISFSFLNHLVFIPPNFLWASSPWSDEPPPDYLCFPSQIWSVTRATKFHSPFGKPRCPPVHHRGKHITHSAVGKFKPPTDFFPSRIKVGCEEMVWVGPSDSESHSLVIIAE